MIRTNRSKPRITKKKDKRFTDVHSLVKYLGVVLFTPGLTKTKCAHLKRACRNAPMRYKRIIHETLAFHRRCGYTAVKIRYRPSSRAQYTKMHWGKHGPTQIVTRMMSTAVKMVPAKDVAWWETQLNVVTIYR